MSNTPLPPLDLAFKEQLNQLNQFGEMMMNRINDRVDRLLERLTPMTQGNNPGVINATPLGGVEMQNGNQPPNKGTADPMRQPRRGQRTKHLNVSECSERVQGNSCLGDLLVPP